MNLKNNNNLEVYIFNVDRGLSILCKTPQNHVLIYDLGSTKDLSPIKNIYTAKGFFSKMDEYEKGMIIAQTIISHPHLDHISDLTDENVSFIKNNSALITCQNDKEEKPENIHFNKAGHKIDFNRVNNPDNACAQIENYKSLYKNRCLPLRTIDPKIEDCNFKMGYYYLSHKKITELFTESQNQEYTNSLSIVLYIYYNDYSILIPGDITPEAFKLIIDGKCEKRFIDCTYGMSDTLRDTWISSTSTQPSLKDLLTKNRLTFLVAPHHGLESCFPEYLFTTMGKKKPYLILISEKPQSENSGSVDKRYQSEECTDGIDFHGKKRYSLTTRNDGNFKIVINEKCTIDSYNDYGDMFK